MRNINDKRDNIDNILRKRLENIDATPPPGSWERIARSLGQTPPAPMTWWVRNRRTVISVAACALPLLMGLAWLLSDNLGQRDILPPVTTPPNIQPIAVTPPAGPEAPAIGGEQLPGRTIESLRRLAVANLGSTHEAAETIVLPEPEAAADCEIRLQAAATEKERAEVPAAGPENTPGSSTKRTPDWGAIAMNDRRPKRTRGRVSATLYAGNINGSSTTSIFSGEAARLSAMGVVENTDGLHGSHDSGMIMATPDDMGPMPTNTPEPNDGVTMKHRMPLSAGVSVGVRITERMSLESGLIYTYLHSSSDVEMHSTYTIRQGLHYIGIPLAVNYYAVDRNKWGLYIRGGGAIEKGIRGHRTTEIALRGESAHNSRTSENFRIKGVQPSLNGAVGAEWRFLRPLSLYAEPGVGYYFTQRSQPDSYRTEHPLNFTMKVGLRVELGRR